MRNSYETYRYFTLEWNVARAWAAIESGAWPLEAKMVPVEQLAAGLSMRRVNEARAMTDVINLSVPLIAGPTRPEYGGGNILIDGGHRLHKAQQTGVTHLLVYILSDTQMVVLECPSQYVSDQRDPYTHRCGALIHRVTHSYRRPRTADHPATVDRRRWYVDPDDIYDVPVVVCPACGGKLAPATLRKGRPGSARA